MAMLHSPLVGGVEHLEKTLPLQADLEKGVIKDRTHYHGGFLLATPTL